MLFEISETKWDAWTFVVSLTTSWASGDDEDTGGDAGDEATEDLPGEEISDWGFDDGLSGDSPSVVAGSVISGDRGRTA